MAPETRGPAALRAGVGRLEPFAHRFRHGFAQLLITLRAIRADRFAWKRYLVVCGIQALVTVAITGVFVSTAKRSSEDLREERVRSALEKVGATDPGKVDAQAVAPGRRAQATPPTPPGKRTAGKSPTVPAVPAPPPPAPRPAARPEAAASNDQDDDDDEEEQDQHAGAVIRSDDEDETDVDTPAEFQKAVRALNAAIANLGKEAGDTAVRRDKAFQEARKTLDEQLAGLERSAEKVQLTDEDRAALIGLGSKLDVLQQKTRPGFWDSALALILSLYGTLIVVQAGVIALSRDYHAGIARDASLLLGVAPEDPPLVPRVRLNVAWIRRKLKQRTRSLLAFLPGVGLISLAAMPFPHRAALTTVLTSLWAAYWWVVWTASKSARAWEREGVARPPWFLRVWHQRVASLPVIGGMARAWEPLWSRLTRSVFSPAEAVEAQPVEFAGLAAARALQLIPLLKLFVRPLVPVAAARLLAERAPRAELMLGSVAERESLAAQRAAVPASAGAIRARDDM